jgi:hypothetical protein
VSDVEDDDTFRVVTDGVRDDPMMWIREVGVPRLRTLERDHEPVLQTVLEALRTRGMTLHDADDSGDGLPECANDRPDELFDGASAAALPGDENDMGYLGHPVKYRLRGRPPATGSRLRLPHRLRLGISPRWGAPARGPWDWRGGTVAASYLAAQVGYVVAAWLTVAGSVYRLWAFRRKPVSDRAH